MSHQKLGAWGALLSGIAALITSVVGVLVFLDLKPKTPNEYKPTSETNKPVITTPAQSIEFTITDINPIGSRLISEKTQVFIEGKLVANLMVDQQHVIDSAKLQVPKSGAYVYRLVGYSSVINPFGFTYNLEFHGKGTIQVNAGSKFEVIAMPQQGLELKQF